MNDDPSRVTVLFIDVTDSVGLYARHGDRAAYELVTTCLEVVEKALLDNGVRTVKRLGDAVLALAPSPDDALQAAMRARDRVRDDERFGGNEVVVRSGITYGSAVLTSSDVYGIVNVAARLIALAKGGEILLAEDAREALAPDLREATRSLNPQVLRGRKIQSLVYEYAPNAPDVTRAATRAPTSPLALELRYGSEVKVIAAGGVVRIGRAEDNDIIIADEVVSRHHAVITFSSNQFVLTDRSTNGSYVRTNSGESTYAQRSQVTLVGGGDIFAGSERLEPIHFKVRGIAPDAASDA